MAIDPTVLQELALAPEETRTDEGTVRERRLKDLIEFDQYLGNTTATESPLHGLRISRCKPAGP